MDKRRDPEMSKEERSAYGNLEMPKEERSLLNAGHGPPFPHGSCVASGIYSGAKTTTPATSLFHRNATCSDFEPRVVNSTGFYGYDRYQQMFLNRPEIADVPALLQKIKEKDQQLQKLSNDLQMMQTNGGQKLFGKC